jgi:hypothetical protein
LHTADLVPVAKDPPLSGLFVFPEFLPASMPPPKDIDFPPN